MFKKRHLCVFVRVFFVVVPLSSRASLSFSFSWSEVRFLRSRAARGATGKVRCAIATLGDAAQAQRCIAAATGSTMDGRPLQVWVVR